MAQVAEDFWRDVTEALTVPAGAGGERTAASIMRVAGSLYGEDDDDAVDPSWCVDDGNGIVVMTSEAILGERAAGNLAADTLKVWRDGMPYWLRLDEVVELRLKPPPHDAYPDSHVRRRERRRDDRSVAAPAPEASISATAVRYLFILAASLVFGFVLTGAVVAPTAAMPRLLTITEAVTVRGGAALRPLLDGRAATVYPQRDWLHGQ